MKKTFKHAILALAILCTGGMTTSCDSDTLMQLATAIIGNLFNTGETYTYTGQATSQSMTGSITTMTWTAINKTTANPTGAYAFSNVPVSLQCGTTATLSLPAYEEGNVKVNAVTIYGLSLKYDENQNMTNLEIGENSTIDGSMEYGGKTYEAANLYIENIKTIDKATATSGNLEVDMTIYFKSADETECTKAVNFTYTGVADTAAE